MKTLAAIGFASLLTLSACSTLPPASAEQLAALPIVTYPDTPPKGDYVFKLPAGKPIDLRVLVEGTALAGKVDQTVSARLGQDIYLHKGWASEDGKRWVDRRELVSVNLGVVLPSYETPRSGEVHIKVDRKATQ